MCALLKRNIVGKTVKRAHLRLDTLLFPALKSASDPESVLTDFQKRLEGSKVEAVRRHGKYFWLWLEKEKEKLAVLMHFGMTGMVHLRDVKSHLVFMENGGDKKIKLEKENGDETPELELEPEPQEWPPRFSKFELELENGKKTELAFVDPRRLARVRLLWGPECSSDELLMQQEPLKRQGPDYSKGEEREVKKEEEVKEEEGEVKREVKKEEGEEENKIKEEAEGEEVLAKAEQEVISLFSPSHEPSVSDFPRPTVFHPDPDPDPHGRARLAFPDFAKLVLSRRKPIKALLLDQAFFAGVGNWVSDEILYHAQIHPSENLAEHISDPEDPRLARLYYSLIYVMEVSVAVEGNVREFPENWLMLHRWGKRRKEKAKTKMGYSVAFETVGGRTSCFVPELQKRMGPAVKRRKTSKEKQSGGE